MGHAGAGFGAVAGDDAFEDRFVLPDLGGIVVGGDGVLQGGVGRMEQLQEEHFEETAHHAAFGGPGHLHVEKIPDIPVFTAEEEMGEYGEHFSKIERHFLEAANLARNNEKKVKGIVINAFSEPFVVPIEMFDLIADIPSCFEDKAEPDNK